MKITVLCSDSNHPVYFYLDGWCKKQSENHDVELISDLNNVTGGDLLFLISCVDIIPETIQQLYGVTLVIHASDLPYGRGWSPLIWQILEGKTKIALTLLEAKNPVDSGPIWKKIWLNFEGTELYDELNEILFNAELALMDFAINNLGNVKKIVQDNGKATFYPRRYPEHSRIDPNTSIAENFDLLRVSDPSRYPAFFEYRGEFYNVTLRRRVKP